MDNEFDYSVSNNDCDRGGFVSFSRWRGFTTAHNRDFCFAKMIRVFYFFLLQNWLVTSLQTVIFCGAKNGKRFGLFPQPFPNLLMRLRLLKEVKGRSRLKIVR